MSRAARSVIRLSDGRVVEDRARRRGGAAAARARRAGQRRDRVTALEALRMALRRASSRTGCARC